MDSLTFATFAAVMALFAVALGVVALGTRVAVSGEAAGSLGDAARWLAWMVAAACMAGSLIFSEVYDFEPCLLCWYQRIAMYPMAVVLLVGAIRRDRCIRLYALPLAIVGLGISIWHILIQNVAALQGAGACDPDNPCSFKYVEVFGFVSIPVMAAAGFFLISVLLAAFGNLTSPVSEST